MISKIPTVLGPNEYYKYNLRLGDIDIKQMVESSKSKFKIVKREQDSLPEIDVSQIKQNLRIVEQKVIRRHFFRRTKSFIETDITDQYIKNTVVERPNSTSDHTNLVSKLIPLWYRGRTICFSIEMSAQLRAY